MPYQHLFFDLDKTIAPSREPMQPEMYELLSGLEQDIVIVSGQAVDKIAWQSNYLSAVRLGQNGNHAVDQSDNLLWYTPLTESEREEILTHIEVLTDALDEKPDPAYESIEDRGAQITFSPVGNKAPVELKRSYDPDLQKRKTLLSQHPFQSDNLTVKIGGSTSLDYIHKDRHKGSHVQNLIEHYNWEQTACVYFGDGLYPGGNDESVIGVIDTIPVQDHKDTYQILKRMFS